MDSRSRNSAHEAKRGDGRASYGFDHPDRQSDPGNCPAARCPPLVLGVVRSCRWSFWSVEVKVGDHGLAGTPGVLK